MSVPAEELGLQDQQLEALLTETPREQPPQPSSFASAPAPISPEDTRGLQDQQLEALLRGEVITAPPPPGQATVERPLVWRHPVTKQSVEIDSTPLERPKAAVATPMEMGRMLAGGGPAAAVAFAAAKPAAQDLELLTKAADAGVIYDQAAPAGLVDSGFAFDEPNRIKAFERALADHYGHEVPVRVGPQTGELQFLNPLAKRWQLVNPPGLDLASVKAATAETAQILTELGVVGAAFTATLPGSPLGAVTASAAIDGVAAASSSVMRWMYGKYVLGINQDISDEQIFARAAKDAGLAAGLGAAGGVLFRFGSFVKEVMQGRFTASELLGVDERIRLERLASQKATPKNQAQIQEARDTIASLEESRETALRLQDTLNAAIAGTGKRLDFRTSQVTGDPNLLAFESMLSKRRENITAFAQSKRAQADAIETFYDVINVQSGASRGLAANPEVTGQAIQSAVRLGDETAQAMDAVQAAVIFREQELKARLRNIPLRDPDRLGAVIRNGLDQHVEAWRREASVRAKALSDLAGSSAIEFEATAPKVQALLKKMVRVKDQIGLNTETGTARLLGVDVNRARRILADLDAQDQDAIDALPALFTGGSVDFDLAWSTVSALKRMARIANKPGDAITDPDTGVLKQLIQTMEADIENSFRREGGGLWTHYNAFKKWYAQGRAQFDEGVVNDLLARQRGPGSRFVIKDEELFSKTFSRGDIANAQQVFDIVKDSPKAMQAVREGFQDFYRRTVFDSAEGTFDRAKHNAFFNDHDRQLELFFTKAEVRKLKDPGSWDKVLDGKRRQLENLRQQFDASTNGRLVSENPEDIFRFLVRESAGGSPRAVNNVMRIIEKHPQREVLENGLRSGLRREMSRKIFDGPNVRREGYELNFRKLVKFLDGDSPEDKGLLEVMGRVFGPDYQRNLSSLRDVLKLAVKESKQANVSNTAGEMEMARVLARAYVGIFTMPGRAITAIYKVAKKNADDVLFNALMNPPALDELMRLRKVAIRDARAVTLIAGLGGHTILEALDLNDLPEQRVINRVTGPPATGRFR